MVKLCSTVLIVFNSLTTAICNLSPTVLPLAKLDWAATRIKHIFDNDLIYIDKTYFAFILITDDDAQVCLLRPRQFGKSLFLDTLKEILEGNKELFKNYYIGKTNYAWKKHIVLIFDFSLFSLEEEGDLGKKLSQELFKMATINGVCIIGEDFDDLLKDLLLALSNKIDYSTFHGIAVLIDEYDAQIVRHLGNPSLSENIFQKMNSFFSILKSHSDIINFTYVTGVSNFALFSTGSGPNHITDISLQPRYATALGYTEDEIKKHFSKYIHHMAKTRSQTGDKVVTDQNILKEMHTWYEGYFFSEDTSPQKSIFNPCSITQYFLHGRIKNTWSTKERAQLLRHEFQKQSLDVVLQTCYITPKIIDEVTLESGSDISNIKLLPLFYYHGYFSIKEYYKNQTYCLDFPNLEVKHAFDKEIDLAVEDWKYEITNLKSCLEISDLEQFFRTLNSIFLNVPSKLYDVDSTEKAFHMAIQVLLTAADIPAKSEYTCSLGTPDIVVELKSTVIIFELKMARGHKNAADIALNQAREKKYANLFFNKEKNVTVVGVSINTSLREICWKAEYYLDNGEQIDPLASL
ncbi:uncharacterized protein in vnfD 5'region-like [Planococcus citri]|uniref:uncharacterized protein in vnfD 5'region-like n=1 Tax=Planococcus citri TaxID=170843 RepID=UPI0031F76611